MRQIEAQMIRAINERRDWCSKGANGFTCVEIAQHVGNPYCIATVYLHGNMIAEVVPSEGSRQYDKPGMGWAVIPDSHTFREFPTPTTRSRLRALGVDAAIRQGEPMIAGKSA